MPKFMWTPERHAVLVAARARSPGQSDADTAAELGRLRGMRGVTSKMVRDRWLNHVVFDYRPTARQMNDWTDMVVGLVSTHGKKWAVIGPIVRKRVRLAVSNEVVKRIWVRHDKARSEREREHDYGHLPCALQAVLEAELLDDSDLVYLPFPDTPTSNVAVDPWKQLQFL